MNYSCPHARCLDPSTDRLAWLSRIAFLRGSWIESPQGIGDGMNVNAVTGMVVRDGIIDFLILLAFADLLTDLRAHLLAYLLTY